MRPAPSRLAGATTDSDGRFPTPLRDALAAGLELCHHPLLDELAVHPVRRPLHLEKAIPKRTLAVSVTGKACHLQCAHCRGHYLEGMKPLAAVTGKDLAGCSSLLVSGGSLATGEVPLADHLDSLRRLPASLPLNLHVGLQDGHLLEELAGRPITVSFDLIGDDRTARDVFGLDRPATAWFEAYERLARVFPVIPHLTIGLRGGRLSGEERVLDFLADRPPPALTFLVFRPTPGTPFADCPPPPLPEVTHLIREAATRLPCPIHLGCMRPAGAYRRQLDILGWAAGARTIVMPDRALTAALTEAGVPSGERWECCSLPSSPASHESS